jgi:uncharacterized membrane protein HdeD (DUF308 family)
MLDGILYVCSMVAALIGALLVFHGAGMIIYYFRGRKVTKYNNAGHRFFDRVK